MSNHLKSSYSYLNLLEEHYMADYSLDIWNMILLDLGRGISFSVHHCCEIAFCFNFVNYRHRRQAADLPAKVEKRNGCAYKRGCSLEIGWSPIFVKILGHKFLVNFYVTFPCKTTYIALRTERSRDLSG